MKVGRLQLGLLGVITLLCIQSADPGISASPQAATRTSFMTDYGDVQDDFSSTNVGEQSQSSSTSAVTELPAPGPTVKPQLAVASLPAGAAAKYELAFSAPVASSAPSLPSSQQAFAPPSCEAPGAVSDQLAFPVAPVKQPAVLQQPVRYQYSYAGGNCRRGRCSRR